MSLLRAPGPVLPALPTHAPIEHQWAVDDWVYVIARWPDSHFPMRFVWRKGEECWTGVALH